MKTFKRLVGRKVVKFVSHMLGAPIEFRIQLEGVTLETPLCETGISAEITGFFRLTRLLHVGRRVRGYVGVM